MSTIVVTVSFEEDGKLRPLARRQFELLDDEYLRSLHVQRVIWKGRALSGHIRSDVPLHFDFTPLRQVGADV